MALRTHKLASDEFIGQVTELGDGMARAVLKTRKEMVVDEYGLVHGAYTFGIADLAAMAAVNDPNVVLVEAHVRFTKPVMLGDVIEAEANVVSIEGRWYTVKVEVKKSSTDETVLKGEMKCYVPKRHVLQRAKKE